MELKREVEKFTIKLGDFNTLLSVINKKQRAQIIKDIKDLENTINKWFNGHLLDNLLHNSDYTF